MGLYRPINFGKEQFPALTGIRAMCAATGFFVHLPFSIGYNVMVDVMAFFFVLSGFLIVYIYYENAAVKAGKLRQYFVNRFARIYPIYFLLVTIAIILKHDYRTIFLVKNYTLTHALFYNQADRAIQPSWSVTTEECFYLLVPFIMYLLRKYNFAVALLFGTSLLGIALYISTLPVSFLHTADFVFSVTFFGHFFEFFCGIFLALIVLKRKKNNTLFRIGKKYTIAGYTGILIVMAVFILNGNMHQPGEHAQYILVNYFMLPIPVAILYYGLVSEKGITSKILSTKLFGVLGRTSYAFYLVHMMVIESIAAPFIAKYFQENYNLYVLIVFILTQLIAFLLFAFFEEPFNMYIRKKFTKQPVKHI